MLTIIYKTKLIPDFSIKEYILADELLFKNKYKKIFEEQGRTLKTHRIDNKTKIKLEQNIKLLEKEYKNRSTSDYIHESILESLFEVPFIASLDQVLNNKSDKFELNYNRYYLVNEKCLQHLKEVLDEICKIISYPNLKNPYHKKIKEWLDAINSLSIDFENEVLNSTTIRKTTMEQIKFVKLLDKNKFAFTTKDEWRTIEITNALGSKYVNISPYYMLDTNKYDLIEDVEFIDVLDELEPKLLKIFKTKNEAKLETNKTNNGDKIMENYITYDIKLNLNKMGIYSGLTEKLWLSKEDIENELSYLEEFNEKTCGCI